MFARDTLRRRRSGGSGRPGGWRWVRCVEREHHDRAISARDVLLAVRVLFRRAVHVVQSLVEAQVNFLHLLLTFGVRIAANIRSKPKRFADGIGHFDGCEICRSARLNARLRE